MKKYFKGVGIWITQSINVFFWPLLNWYFETNKFGDPDEYTSSVLGKLEIEGNYKACKVCEWIDKIFFDDNHCIKSIENDEGKTD